MFVVGCAYEVPTINYDGTTFVVLHEHLGEISGKVHQHIDLRFLPNSEIERRNWQRDAIYACMPQPVIMRKMVCYSTYTPIKTFSEHHRADFMKTQKLVQNRTMKCRVCPHQGYDLSKVPNSKINGKDVVVCPCHGITWDVQTGSMVRRLPRKHHVSRH